MNGQRLISNKQSLIQISSYEIGIHSKAVLTVQANMWLKTKVIYMLVSFPKPEQTVRARGISDNHIHSEINFCK